MTDSAETHEGTGEIQHYLDGARLIDALTAHDPAALLVPAIAAVLRDLNLRVYPTSSDLSDYMVLDLHGASIAVQRRPDALYLHVDTTETADQRIAFEVNGCGEFDHDLF
ncbi:hypothetical protein [Actinoplanes siamensis]|uniref:Uncharacterized protein n=1 Tax=Actinoplanes siamensis TaxID=1223317 RepID=A0A919TJU6_9ACTN|nr:hypothetical protein [Actinoplanes siamensis]GIF04660.1 hypothetical protein Asi03nite_21980 [Actinoplanes siamensis]